jgi:NADH-quinone oxidoreductase subunit I
VQTIDIEAEESPDPKIEKRPKEFSINMLRCIYCGMCVEACPKDAIYMTQDYEFANQTRDQMIFRINDLLDPLPGEQCPKASKDGKKKE